MSTASHVIGRMPANTATDMLVGTIPTLGDLFDATFKSIHSNFAILREQLERKGAVPAGQPQTA
mgnify:CR=1 FL=1